MVWSGNKAPEQKTEDGQALAFWMEDELERFANDQNENLQAVDLRPVFVAPLRPRTGMLVYADGTRWDPGRGEGVYSYKSDGTWKLLLAPTDPLPVANGGTGDTGSIWTAYTPSLTVSAGTLTTFTALGRFKTIGKTVFIELELIITNNGTGATGIIAGLPAAAISTSRATLIGTDVGVSGKAITGRLTGSGTTVLVTNYDASYPAVSGSRLVLSGVYEST